MLAKCPECDRNGKLRDEFAGKKVRCPGCGADFVAVASQQVKWYYAVGEEKVGPIQQGQFNNLVDDGTISPETLVWCKGLDGWQALSEIQYVDSVGDSDSGKIKAGSGLEYGALWRRMIAKFIDLVFMLALAGMVEGLSRKLFPGAFTSNTLSPVVIVAVVLNITIGIFYVTWFVGKLRATPGKMVVRLKISNPAGGKISYGHAFGRYCGEYVASLGVMVTLALFSFWSFSSYLPFDQVLSSTMGAVFITLMIVYLPAFFDRQRRTLYDRLCNTRVLAA